MKRYHFTLEAVLRLRRLEEEQAKSNLLRANGELRRLLELREVRRRRYDEIARRADAVTPDGLMAERLERELLARQLDEVEGAVATAAAGAAYAQLSYRAFAAKVEALERLETRQREEHAAGEQREESSLVDDLVTARFAREHVHPKAFGR